MDKGRPISKPELQPDRTGELTSSERRFERGAEASATSARDPSLCASGWRMTACRKRTPMRHSGAVGSSSHGAHAKPGSLRARDHLGVGAGVVVVILFVVSAVGYGVSSTADRKIWKVVFAVALVVMLALITAEKLRSTRPVGPVLDFRYIVLAVVAAVGGSGLALTGGDHPTIWSRLLGIAIGFGGLLMSLAELRQWRLRLRPTRPPDAQTMPREARSD